MQYLEKIMESVSGGIPSLIYAIILLIAAWLAAWVVKTVVVKVCRKLKLDERLDKLNEDENENYEKSKDSEDISSTFGKIAFVIVFIFLLPGILDNLNLQGVAEPIVNMMNSLLGYLPRIFGAAAIFIMGLFFAKIVKQIIISLMKRFDFDKLQKKAGIASDNSTVSLSSLVGNAVYCLIILPVIIAALNVLNISSITVPAVNMLNIILSVIPNIFIAVVLIAIGVFIGRLVGSLLSSLLSGLGVNNLMGGIIKETNGKKLNFANIAGDFVKFIIILLFAAQAVNVLHLEILNGIGIMIINYLPNFIGALIIFIAGSFLASFVEKTVKQFAAKSFVSAKVIKYVIIVITAFITLNQLHIASFIVNTTFIVVLGAAAAAFVIAFGIGGKDTANRILKNIIGSLHKNNAGNNDDKSDLVKFDDKLK